MPPTLSASPIGDRATVFRARLRRNGRARKLMLSLLVPTAIAACGTRDAIVGSAPAGDGAAATPQWTSELAADDGLWDVQTVLNGASVAFGARNADAPDGRVAELRFPGRPDLGPADDAGPDLATQIATKRFFHYGTFRSRVQFATCTPGEELASAVFLFFNDGSDGNGNGIPDNPELDFQVLCDAPTFIVLTAWADFQKQANGVERFVKLSHAVDTATGDLYDAVSPTDRAFAKTGTATQLLRPSFSPSGFYDVGIEWRPTQVRFFIVLDGTELTLWTVTDSRFVPSVPLPLMFNLWHPQTHWVPRTTDASYPAHDGVLRVDRVSYDPI